MARDDPELLALAIFFAAAVPAMLYLAHRWLNVFQGIRPTGMTLFALATMYYVNALPFVYDYCSDKPALAMRYLGALLLMFAGICAGCGLADRFRRPVAIMPSDWGCAPGLPQLGNPVIFWSLVVVFAAASLYHVFLSGGVRAIFLFGASEGEPWYLAELRSDVNAPIGTSYIASLARFAILPPLALGALSYAFQRRTTGLLVAAGGIWLVVAFSRVATLHKAPAVFWLLAPGVLWATRRSSRRAMLSIVIGVVGFGLLMVFLYGFIYGAGWEVGWDSTVARVTEVPQQTLIRYLETFPDLHPFLGGDSISFVRMLSGSGEGMPSYAYLQEIWHVGGTPNAGFIGDAWADFGWTGVVALSLLAGIVLRLLESVVLSMPRTALAHGLFVFVTLAAINLTSVSLWTTLLTHGLGLGPAVVFVLWWLRGGREAEVRA